MVGLFEVLNVLRGLAPVEPFSTDPGDGQPCEEDDEEMETVKKSKKKSTEGKESKETRKKMQAKVFENQEDCTGKPACGKTRSPGTAKLQCLRGQIVQ